MLNEKQVGRDLYEKIKELFAEFDPFLCEGDEENRNVVLGTLIDSLEKAGAAAIDCDLMERLSRFRDWAENYPRGDEAADDLYTSYVVSFVEGMLEHESLYRLAPAIISKEDLIRGKDYFYTWIGPGEYHRALTAFPNGEGAN